MQRDRQRHGTTLADDAELRGAAERLGGEAVAEGIRVIDAGAVDADDQISGFQSALGGRTRGSDVRHQRARRPRQAHTVGDIRGHVLQLGAEPRPLHRAAAALGRGDHNPHHIGGNREAYSLRAARARIDRRVDANEPAGHIDQRTAGIAGINRRVGLDDNR